MGIIENFEAMLAAGNDNVLLRYGLGNAYLKEGKHDLALEHLRQAVRLDPNYSAAWKSLGKAFAEAGRASEAMEAYASGIQVAEKKGDIQAAKEMRVFLKRLQKAQGG